MGDVLQYCYTVYWKGRKIIGRIICQGSGSVKQKRKKHILEKLNNTVNSIIASGESAGKAYTKYDRMRLMAFHDERGFSDFDLNAEFDRIQKLEDEENGINQQRSDNI